ncbi:MAG: FtsX-like permease family protein, partial [Dehalococcoidia bacterium]
LSQGDISLLALSVPLSTDALATFARLKTKGIISGYTPESVSGAIVRTRGGGLRFVSVRVVDPVTFPLVDGPTLIGPSHATVKGLLSTAGNALVTQSLSDELQLKSGDPLKLLGVKGSVKLAGDVANDNATASGDQLIVSIDTWRQVRDLPVTFGIVAVTTSDRPHRDQAVSALQHQFPLAVARTTDDLLKNNSKEFDGISTFLDVVGLVALLIGGVGIVHTMQVLLSRRRMEIAVLKTSGYRRRDLYLLFGIEATLLGLGGGVVGALLAVGVGAGIRQLFFRAFHLVLPFSVDPGTIFGGIVIGVATSLIFALMPIVRAASLRPQAVIRALPEENETVSRLQTVGLLLLLSVLFFMLSVAILGSILRAALAVYGSFLLLGLLSLGLYGLLAGIGRLPVPERYGIRYLLLVTFCLLVALGLTWIASTRGAGITLLAFVMVGYLIVPLPRPWKVNIKLAFRNIGRTRGRTTTTMLALFIGVFTVGLILVFGQDVQGAFRKALSDNVQYNLLAFVQNQNAGEIDSQLPALPGLRRYRVSDVAQAGLDTINGRPITAIVPQGQTGANAELQRQVRLLNGVQGYELGKGDLPSRDTITAGRNLAAGDTDSTNALINDELRKPPLTLSPGDTISLKDPQSGRTTGLTIIGFYKPSATQISVNAAPIFAAQRVAADLAGSSLFRVYFLQVADAAAKKATTRLADAAPEALVLNLNDLLGQLEQIVNNILLMLTAIGSLALLAGIIIVANAVALATLERRRELGILKALGYTSGRVLMGLLIETAVTAGLAGLLGMLLVGLAIAIFNQAGSLHFTVGAPIAILIIGGVASLATLIALIVAWPAVRVRPAAVLRYE